MIDRVMGRAAMRAVHRWSAWSRAHGENPEMPETESRRLMAILWRTSRLPRFAAPAESWWSSGLP